MSWTELHIKTHAEYAPILSEELTHLGADAITFQDAGDQPIYEPTPGILWQKTRVIGLYRANTPLDPTLIFLMSQISAGNIETFELKNLEDQAWERICLQYFKPMSFGKRLWICPSWTKPPVENAINVILDPGLAFGTGTHPTTTLCLEWLDEHMKPGLKIIDYGCGSGILAISALKLGAIEAYAVDNDPQALLATQQNAARNNIYPPILKTYRPEEILELAPKADVLIANILAQPLMQLAETFINLLQPHGNIILSGILVEQMDEIRKIYGTWFDLDNEVSKNQWVRISGRLRESCNKL